MAILIGPYDPKTINIILMDIHTVRNTLSSVHAGDMPSAQAQALKNLRWIGASLESLWLKFKSEVGFDEA